MYSYATLTTGGDRVAVFLRNTTEDWVLIEKGVPIARMEASNLVPPVMADFIMSKPQAQKLSEEERQKALMEKLDLSGLVGWDEDLAAKAKDLLMEYHNLFSLEKSEIDKTKTVEHTIVLKDPDTAPLQRMVLLNTTSTGGRSKGASEVDVGGRSHSAKQQPLVQCSGIGVEEG